MNTGKTSVSVPRSSEAYPETSEEPSCLRILPSGKRKLVYPTTSKMCSLLSAAKNHAQETEKLRSLGVLAGGIAHDFNNLLVGILGNVDLALREMPDTAGVRESLESIRLCALRASELTDQILAYAGKGRFWICPVNLNELTTEITRLLWTNLSRKAKLHYDLCGRLPAVQADVTQMRQVLMNLITNASEALGEEAGQIHIRTSVSHMDAAALCGLHLGEGLSEGRYVCLEVSDTGDGMNEETLARVFDPFFSTKFTGRGLGLSAVLGIVRAHRGAIDILSAPGEGTTFRIYLPASNRSCRPTEPQPAENAEAGLDSGTLLVVDDEPAVLKVARAMLERLGFTVVLAGNGQEAVDLFAPHAEEIRAVLLDMSMPGMDGRETFHLLREIRPDVRAILCSGYTEQIAVERFSGLGLAGFLQKPYEMDRMARTLRRVLGEELREA